MKNEANNKIFWFITWTVLLVVLVSMTAVGLFAVFSGGSASTSTDTPGLDIRSSTKMLQIDDLVAPLRAKQKAAVKKNISGSVDFEPSMQADPLFGEEKYIFQLSSIVEQYYPDVDPYIALAVMETESRYNPDALSSAGAVGLMQVIPEYHAWRATRYGLTDIWDSYTNILVGVDYLNELYQTYGDWSTALYGYNHSWGYVDHVLTRANSMRGDGYFG